MRERCEMLVSGRPPKICMNTATFLVRNTMRSRNQKKVCAGCLPVYCDTIPDQAQVSRLDFT